jgi:hypothetical protein
MLTDQWITPAVPTSEEAPAGEQMEFEFDDFFFVE